MLPDWLRPDRAKYPRLNDVEWKTALAVLDEGARRQGMPGMARPLNLRLSRMLPRTRPYLLTRSSEQPLGESSTSLDDLPHAEGVTLTPPVYRVVLDVAQAAQQWEP